MPNLAEHKLFLPLSSVISIVVSTAAVIWYVAGVKLDISNQIYGVSRDIAVINEKLDANKNQIASLDAKNEQISAAMDDVWKEIYKFDGILGVKPS